MYDSDPPQVWLIVVWVFIGILIFLICSLMICWKRIQRWMVRWMSKRSSVVAPMKRPPPRGSLMKAFRANSLFQPTIPNKSRLSLPIKAPTNIDLESGQLIPAQWPNHPAQYKLNVWRYDPMMRKVSVNEHEEIDYATTKVEATKVEATKVDAPKVDAPKVDAPKVDAPQLCPKKVRVKIKKKKNQVEPTLMSQEQIIII